MNTLNFDPVHVDNYPLSIDRMAELQHNLGAAADIFTNIHPHGDCILAGCESAGDAGYVRLDTRNTNGNTTQMHIPEYEIFEVEADTSGLSNPGWLVLEETTTTVNNSVGSSVVVSSKRVLKWATSDPGGDVVRRRWASLRHAKLRISPALQDHDWDGCTSGQGIDTNITDGQAPQAGIFDGRLRIRGRFAISSYNSGIPLFTLPYYIGINYDTPIPCFTLAVNGGSVTGSFVAVLRCNTAGISLAGSPLWAPVTNGHAVIVDINAAVDL